MAMISNSPVQRMGSPPISMASPSAPATSDAEREQDGWQPDEIAPQGAPPSLPDSNPQREFVGNSSINQAHRRSSPCNTILVVPSGFYAVVRVMRMSEQAEIDLLLPLIVWRWQVVGPMTDDTQPSFRVIREEQDARMGGVWEWEGEMTVAGRTFEVLAELTFVRSGDVMKEVWDVDVMQRSRFFVVPLWWRQYPTLDEALRGAEQYILHYVALEEARAARWRRFWHRFWWRG
jgi:hypothetical protein